MIAVVHCPTSQLKRRVQALRGGAQALQTVRVGLSEGLWTKPLQYVACAPEVAPINGFVYLELMLQ
jgi:hypothetical protein